MSEQPDLQPDQIRARLDLLLTDYIQIWTRRAATPTQLNEAKDLIYNFIYVLADAGCEITDLQDYVNSTLQANGLSGLFWQWQPGSNNYEN